MNRRHPWFTNGQRTVLSKATCVMGRLLLQRCCAALINAPPCRRRQPGVRNGRGREITRCARATGMSKSSVSPLQPLPASRHTNIMANKRHQQRDDHNDWRMMRAETVNKPLTGARRSSASSISVRIRSIALALCSDSTCGDETVNAGRAPPGLCRPLRAPPG